MSPDGALVKNGMRVNIMRTGGMKMSCCCENGVSLSSHKVSFWYFFKSAPGITKPYGMTWKCPLCGQVLFPSKRVLAVSGVVEGTMILWWYLFGMMFLTSNIESLPKFAYVLGLATIFMIIRLLVFFVQAWILYYSDWIRMDARLCGIPREEILRGWYKKPYRWASALSVLIILASWIALR